MAKRKIRMMIKKIIILVCTLALCLSPVALANDGGKNPDRERISFSCTVKSKEVQIGEPFEFTIKITNHTSRKARLISFDQIFSESFDTLSADINEIIIEPYRTITLDISYVVPASISWYEQNGEYYVDFCPELFYMAKATLDDSSYDNEEDEGYMYNYWEYYRKSTKTIPFKIANLTDGSEYAQISIIDDKSIIGFNDSTYKEYYSWNGELACEHISYLKIENNCDKEITDICVYEEYQPLDGATLQSGQSYEFRHKYRDWMLEDNIPETITQYYKMIYNLDDRYYCTYISRTYSTKVYDVPKINIRLIKVYDENFDIYRYTYLIENNTDKTYENFAVFYASDRSMKTSYDKYGEHMLLGTFYPDDAWHFPMSFLPNETADLLIGFMEDNTFYYRIFRKNYIYDQDVPDGFVYVLSSGMDTEQSIIDVYHLFNDITATYPTPTIAPAPTIDSTPFVVAISASPVPTPISTPTPTQAKPQITNSRYIPIWVWVWVALAFSILTVALSIGAILISKRKENKEDKNDD